MAMKQDVRMQAYNQVPSESLKDENMADRSTAQLKRGLPPSNGQVIGDISDTICNIYMAAETQGLQ